MQIQAIAKLSSIPLHKQALDLGLLAQDLAEQFKQFQEALLSRQEALLELHASPLALAHTAEGQRRQRIHAWAEGQYRRQQKRLELGYPLLILQDEKLGRKLSAPLWFWSLQLEKGERNSFLLRYSGKEPQLNRLLVNYLEDRFGFDWEELLFSSVPPPKHKLDDWLWPLLKKMDWELDSLALDTPQALGDELRIQKLDNGIYAYGFLSYQEPALAKRIKEQRTENSNWKHKLSYTELRPAQQLVAAHIFEGQSFRLQGPKGSGKTFSISALLPSLLLDKGKILVLCNMQQSFRDWQKELEQLGLSGLPILRLQSEEQDKEQLLELLKQNWQKAPAFDKLAYSQAFHKYKQFDIPLRRAYQALRKPLGDNNSWTETVARFLHYQSRQGKYLLMPVLELEDFSWNRRELDALIEELNEQERLVASLGEFENSPLKHIPDRFFQEQGLEQAIAELRQPLRSAIGSFLELSRNYSLFIDEYLNMRWTLFQEHGRLMAQGLERVLEAYWHYQTIYGQALFEGQSFWAKTKALFSSKQQHISKALADLQGSYKELQQLQESKGYLSQALPPFPHASQLQDWQKELLAYQEYLGTWQQRIPRLIQQQLKSLSLSYPMRKDFKQRLEALEQDWKNWLEAWEAAGFHQDPSIQNKATALLAREGSFRIIAGQLLKLDQALVEEFENYFRWRKHYLSCSALGKKLVGLMRKIGAEDWEAAFGSCYLFHYLMENYHSDLPREDCPIKELVQAKEELRRLLLGPCLQGLEQMRKEALELPKSQSLQGKKLEDWLSDYPLERLLPYYPLVFADSSRLQSLLKGNIQPIFDLIVVEDAHELDAKLQKALRRLAKQIVLVERSEELQEKQDAYMDSFLQQLPVQQIPEQREEDAAFVSGYRQGLFVKDFADFIHSALSQELDRSRLERIENPDWPADILIRPLSPRASSIAIRCEAGLADYAVLEVDFLDKQSQKLAQQGYLLRPEFSVSWWRQPEKALHNLLVFIEHWDRATHQKSE